MTYTRPDPKYPRPELPHIEPKFWADNGYEENSRMVVCEYCGRNTKADNEMCPSCGAMLPEYPWEKPRMIYDTTNTYIGFYDSTGV